MENNLQGFRQPKATSGMDSYPLSRCPKERQHDCGWMSLATGSRLSFLFERIDFFCEFSAYFYFVLL